MVETYYDVLGVPADATQDEIRAAYRERVLETHPDRNDAPDAVERFTRVQTAEEILSDETERARYDRLGHGSYRRLVDRFADASGESGGSENGNGPAGSKVARSERDESRRASSQTTERGADRSTTGRERTNRKARGGRGRDGPSHHARQRARRQRATATAEWWTRNANERDGSAATGARRDGNRADAESAEDDSGSFSYTVHGWEGAVDLDPDRPPLDGQTAVTVAGVTLLYPVFVYASVAPTFSILVNLIVGACTFALVGYLLTMPRVAMVSFGLWSLLVPLVLPRVVAVDPASIVGALIVGAFWVPFGYAIAVWWALRP